MATSQKTVCYPFPVLASMTEATVTNFTQISVTIPESGLTFRSAWVECMADDLITVTGGTITEWRIGFRLGAAGYTTNTNLNDIAHSGENMSPFLCADVTAHFVSNWAGQASGGVATADVQLYIDQSTGTTLNFRNGTALLWITYDYDDTSSTQLYTCLIPFTSPTGALGTSKPGSPTDTIPNLDSFLGYGSIAYKACHVLAEGNANVNASTAADTLNIQVDSLTAYASGSKTQGLASDRYFRDIADMMSGGSMIFTTNATHSLYVWNGTTGRNNHLTLTMIVTFTFDATSSNDGNRSVWLDSRAPSPMGGTTASDYQRFNNELWIAEGATIAIQKSAFRLHWEQSAAIAGLNFRAGSQSFVAYTDAAPTTCGGNALQRTIDDNITLVRGKNTLTADVYRTDGVNRGWLPSGLWILNYKGAKPSGGWGAANRTCKKGINFFGTGASFSEVTVAAIAPTIPEASYLLSCVGAEMAVMSANAGNALTGFSLMVERLSGEGGIKWESLLNESFQTDAEIGVHFTYADASQWFKRTPDDAGLGNRFDLETTRRYRLASGNAIAMWALVLLSYTYHAIPYTVAGTLTGYTGDGSGITVDVFRADTQERIATTTTAAGGTYSVTWYDNVGNVYAVAYQSSGHQGRSDNGVAT